MVHQFKAEVHDLGDRVNQLESTIDKFANTFNALVDTHKDKEEHVEWIKAKPGRSFQVEQCKSTWHSRIGHTRQSERIFH